MVAEGYKETEIGVIPEDWKVDTISSISKKVNVGFVGTCEKFYTDKSNGVFMIRTGNIKERKIDLTSLKYISYEFHHKNIKSQLQINDLLIARHGSSGLCSIVPANFPEANCLNIVMIRINQEICNPIFVMYSFNSNIIQKQMGKNKAGSTQGVVNTKEIANTYIIIPPLKEQEKIADILSSADEKIDAIASQIQKAETLKKGLLQKLLSEGIGHSEFKDSELGKIPENWEVVELRDIGKVSMCKRIMKSETTEYGEIPFYKIGTFGKEANSYISQEIYEDYKKKYSFPKKGDILISASGTIGRTVIYDGVPAYFQDSNIVWIDNKEDKSLNSFLFYVYITVKWHTDGNTIARLYNENLRRIKIPLPPLEEQKQIADILSTADEKLELLRAKKEKYETLKKGLLQKLLSGEVRV